MKESVLSVEDHSTQPCFTSFQMPANPLNIFILTSSVYDY